MNKLYIIAGAVVPVLLQGCTKTVSSAPPSADALQKYDVLDYYVDENGEGGIIVYKDLLEDNEGIMIALSLDEESCRWGDDSKTLFGDGIVDFNIGFLDSICSFTLIMNQYAQANGVDNYPAFKWCQNKNPDIYVGVNSWLLPSFRMWAFVFRNLPLDVINNAIAKYGGTPLSTDCYWTCTEDWPDYLHFEERFKLYEEYYGFNPVERSITINPENSLPVNKNFWKKEEIHPVRAMKFVYFYENVLAGKED